MSEVAAVQRRRFLRAPRRLPPAPAARKLPPPEELLEAAAYRCNKQRKLLTAAKLAAQYAEKLEEEQRELAVSLLTQRLVFSPEAQYECDFCANPMTAIELVQPIVCPHCSQTVYCSDKCRKDDAVSGTHTVAICNSANVKNRIVCQKMGFVLDRLLPTDIVAVLHWMQCSIWARQWVQRFLQGKSAMPVNEAGAYHDKEESEPENDEYEEAVEEGKHHPSPKSGLLHSNRIEFCYVAWMYAVMRMELSTLMMLAIQDLMEWAQTAREPKTVSLVQRPLSCAKEEKVITLASLSKEECKCCVDRLTKSAQCGTQWLKDNCGHMALKDLRTSRLVTSDGQGLIVRVEHVELGELLHLHLKTVNQSDRQSMRRLNWAQIFYIRSECPPMTQHRYSSPSSCLNFSGKPTLPGLLSSTPSKAAAAATAAVDDVEEQQNAAAPCLIVVGYRAAKPTKSAQQHISYKPKKAPQVASRTQSTKSKTQTTTKSKTKPKKNKSVATKSAPSAANTADILAALENRIAVLSVVKSGK